MIVTINEHVTQDKELVLNLFNQMAKFAGVGAIGTGVHYAILIVLVELLSVDVVISTSLGAVAGGMVNYWLNYRYTFNSEASHTKATIKYAILICIGFFINGIIMALGVRYIDVNYLLIQVIATGIVFLWNFVGSKHWVF